MKLGVALQKMIRQLRNRLDSDTSQDEQSDLNKIGADYETTRYLHFELLLLETVLKDIQKDTSNFFFDYKVSDVSDPTDALKVLSIPGVVSKEAYESARQKFQPKGNVPDFYKPERVIIPDFDEWQNAVGNYLGSRPRSG